MAVAYMIAFILLLGSYGRPADHFHVERGTPTPATGPYLILSPAGVPWLEPLASRIGQDTTATGLTSG